MKVLFTLALLVAGSCVFAQPVPKLGLYKWKEVVTMKPCTIDGVVDPTAVSTSSEANQQFRIVLITTDNRAIIQVLDYTEEVSGKLSATPNFFKYNYIGSATTYNTLTDVQKASRNYGTQQAYFSVANAVITEYALRDEFAGVSLAAGVINFPFKFRGSDFSGAFNFGAGVGLTFKHKVWRQFTHSLISGYSISSIVLDNSNTTKGQASLQSSNNYTAFSFSLGYLVQYQRVQVGLFIGFDKLNQLNQDEFGWKYQGEPWVSVGFGLAIFSGEDKNEVASTAQAQSKN